MIYIFVESSSVSNVWINRPLMPSSEGTTQKPGGDFDWLIVQNFTQLFHNYEKF